MIILNMTGEVKPTPSRFAHEDALCAYLQDNDFDDGALISRKTLEVIYIWGEDNDHHIIVFDVRDGCFDILETWDDLATWLLKHQCGEIENSQLIKGKTNFIVEFATT